MQLKVYPKGVLRNQKKTQKAHVQMECQKTFRMIRKWGVANGGVRAGRALIMGKGGGGHEGRHNQEPESQVQDSGEGLHKTDSESNRMNQTAPKS